MGRFPHGRTPRSSSGAPGVRRVAVEQSDERRATDRHEEEHGPEHGRQHTLVYSPPMRFAFLLASLLLAACGGSSMADGGADLGVDAGGVDAGPPTCADVTTTFALPTPQWETGATLAPPAVDVASASLMATEPSWAGELAVLDGWPARPT